MRQALIDMFTSKKFLAALAAVIVYVAGRFGFDVDPGTLDRIVAALLVYVGAQGIADHGKSAAQIAAVASGAAPLGALALVLLLAGGTACTAAQRTEIKHGATASLVNCTAQAIGTTPGLDLATLVAVANTVATDRVKCMTSAGIDWKCVEADAIGKGLTLGGCAFAELVAVAASAFTSAGDRLSATTPILPGRAELADFHARVAPGVTYHTATGDL